MNNIHFSSRAVIVEIYDSPLYGCPEVSNKSHSTTETCSGQEGKRKMAVEGGMANKENSQYQTILDTRHYAVIAVI